MEVFKILGSIFINNEDANNALDETTRKAESTASTLGSKFESIGSGMEQVGKTLMPVSLAVGGALSASVLGASNFTDGMAKMSTLIDTSVVSLDDLSAQFLTLSDNVGMSATDLAEAGYQALSAGVDVDEAVDFVQTAGLLARAGFTSTANAVDVLTTAINAFGLEQSEAESIANKLVTTQNLGKTTVDELASSMGKIIPTANAYGVSIDSILAGYATMTKNGIATAETTTYFNSMLNELGKDGTTASDALREMTGHIQEGGMSFHEMMDAGWDLQDVLSLLDEKAYESGLSMMDMFGSAEAAKAASTLWDKGEEFIEIEGQMGASAGAVSEAIDKLKTPAQEAKEALNRLKNSGIQLGQTLLTTLAPIFEKVVSAVESATSWFNNLSEGQKQTILTMMALVAGLAPVLIIVGKIISAIGTVIGVIKSVQTAMVALNVTMSINPAVLIIAGIVALIAVFVTLWNKSEAFRNFWIELWEGIKTFVTDAVTAIGDFLTGAWETISSGITTAWTAVSEFFSGLWSGISEGVSNAWNGIKTFFSDTWDSMKNTATTVGNSIKTGVTNAWSSIKSGTTSAWDKVKSTVSSAWDNIKTGSSVAGNLLKTTLSNIWNNIKGDSDTIWGGIANAMTHPIETAKGIIKGILDTIKGLFDKLDIQFPSIKLPHFGISPSGWKIGDLLQGSIPKLDIQWYAKGGILQDPTIFGMNGNRAMVGGEAGEEAVAPIETLLGYIRTAVAEQNASLIQSLKDSIKELGDKVSNQGDIVIPVYLGNTMIDDIVVNSKRNVTLRSGGMTSV